MSAYQDDLQNVSIKHAGRGVISGKALVSDGVIILEKVHEGYEWLKGKHEENPFRPLSLKVVTNDSRKRVLLEGAMRFSFMNLEGRKPGDPGIRKFSAILEVVRPFQGYPLYRNYHAHESGEALIREEEYEIFSDRRYIGSFNAGACSILNPIARGDGFAVSAVLRVRLAKSVLCPADSYIDFDPGHRLQSLHRERAVMSFSEEFAAILSVATGTRTASSSEASRSFGVFSDDPRGTPFAPSRPSPFRFTHGGMLPYYNDSLQPKLDMVRAILYRYFSLDPARSGRFLRASKLYQDALIRAEEDPLVSWVWAVSCIESIAEVEGETTQAQAKFLAFLRRFLPPPPGRRPPPPYQADWSNLEGRFKKLYSFRSDFLHAGHPFPSILLFRPDRIPVTHGELFEECPFEGGRWGISFEEIPTHLYIFLYIIRGSLLNWLESESAEPETARDEVSHEADEHPASPTLAAQEQGDGHGTESEE